MRSRGGTASISGDSFLVTVSFMTLDMLLTSQYFKGRYLPVTHLFAPLIKKLTFLLLRIAAAPKPLILNSSSADPRATKPHSLSPPRAGLTLGTHQGPRVLPPPGSGTLTFKETHH